MDKDADGLNFSAKTGAVALPIHLIILLMLGPGTSITQATVKTLAHSHEARSLTAPPQQGHPPDDAAPPRVYALALDQHPGTKHREKAEEGEHADTREGRQVNHERRAFGGEMEAAPLCVF